ncbi:ribonuclease H-like domain-containing protein [Tanacetum coccineum]
MAVEMNSGSNIELISNLDAGNPLYLQNNDNSSIGLVNVKLVGAENYKMWATAVKIALKGKNKMGFIDGTIASDVWTELKETYDKMDGSVVFNLMQKINNLKQDDLSVPGLYIVKFFVRRVDILTILPACVCENRPACCCENKTASAKHNQLIRLMQFLMGLNDVYQPIRSTILAKDPLPNFLTGSFTSDQMMKLLSLINDKPSPAANMTVLKVLEIVGTGSEFGGLYLFDDKIGKNVDVNCNSVFVCHASCELWHCRLGHPADPVMTILGKHLGFSKTNHLSPCDICHKAKQVREPFPLSDHKTTSVGDIIHCEVGGPYRLPSSVLSGVSPYFIVYGKNPSLSHIRYKVLGLLPKVVIQEKKGKDYDKTFKSLVVKWLLLVPDCFISVQNCWPLFQLDVNNAFHMGDLNEEVYMATSSWNIIDKH